MEMNREGAEEQPQRKWECLYCRHPVERGEACPMPDCVEARERARRRMGMQS